MTEFPYSKQIHDKILNDWKDIPFSELRTEYSVISHPSIKYHLWHSAGMIYPRNNDLMYALSEEYAISIYKQLIEQPKETPQKDKTELAAKQFLGLQHERN